MNKPLWVVQDNLGNGEDYVRLLTAFDSLNLPYHPVSIVPFADDFPDVDWEGPLVAYGSTRFVTNVHRAGKWTPGVFFDEDAFTMGQYIERYGDRVLNAAGQLTTIAEFSARDYQPGEVLFVRPDRDLKEFEARVSEVEALGAWFVKIRDDDFELKADTPILVAKPLQIEAEWRLFMVKGRCVGGSCYRTAGLLDIAAPVPEEVTAFAESMADIWSPAEVFVLDIGLVANDLKIIEINCFNSSGFYASDVETIVQEVSNAV
ncbi:ATP-grasp domain-containing protein [Pelagibius sp. Alg239-R121]|uniref:ATP-grasp domain-containing protein n=1 Tax=Pelagibius sp. Alg239-R121 TaxID=2993448 RepID=UPI0024A770A3|nr:ATP-grasp domain-containing protein [Pelagibius sp. Alg239-R121]